TLKTRWPAAFPSISAKYSRTVCVRLVAVGPRGASRYTGVYSDVRELPETLTLISSCSFQRPAAASFSQGIAISAVYGSGPAEEAAYVQAAAGIPMDCFPFSVLSEPVRTTSSASRPRLLSVTVIDLAGMARQAIAG